ncbi:HetP family heterocyst commitment protein [Egbenema bharatensis]|uniref:HetP family heterocyst commitment protein n=1 Tax=Egbenema bharatensis TaxID=3463334 RepID=UPI003A8BB439
MYSRQPSKLDKAMTTEQFNQVVDAILAGKYSWACVLILRFAGYNPLHYIPYRTYNRLMKEHGSTRKKQKREDQHFDTYSESSDRRSSSRIADLNHLETLEDQPCKVRGGDRMIPVFSWFSWGSN